MLFGILSGFMERERLSDFFDADEIKAYSGQLEQGFNVFQTTSTGRVLDAASCLLGISCERKYEGGPAIELEKAASGRPYRLEPVIEKQGKMLVLSTAELFRFLIDNLYRDRARLAITAQMYIAEGLHTIAKKGNKDMVFSGGVALNKAISGFMQKNGVLLNRKIPPGDAGICIGQAEVANL
jgi:hydrogenase maturation protein HypF